MNIIPLQFNFIKSKPQSAVTSPLRMKSPVLKDTVSFSGNTEPVKKPDPLDKLVPKNQGVIYKKVRDKDGNVVKKERVEVDIVKTKANTFQFKKDKKVIGRVELRYIPEESCGDSSSFGGLGRNYEEEDITGARLAVDYLYNDCEEEYGGVGHLADLLEVAACKKLGIKPNVISYSVLDAVPLHYMRGKRFIPLNRFDKKFSKYYDRENLNEVVREIVEKTPKGQNFDTSSIKAPFFVTYMPKEMIKELEEELKEHPIF